MFDIIGQKIQLQSKHAFSFILNEIRMDTYDFDRVDIEENDLIVDIGAHIGIFSCYVASKYPKARVISLEPTNEMFAELSINTAPYPNITAIKCGVGLNDTIKYRNDGTSSPKGDGLEEKINLTTLDMIVLKFGAIKFLKLDCEGAEFDALMNCNHLDKIEYLSAELHGVDIVALRKKLSPHFNMKTFRAYRTEETA